MNTSDDMACLKAAQSGDAEAFEALVNRYYEVMFKMAFKWCRNEQNAQDITQEACINLARGIGSFNGDSAFTSWLYRLVINTAKDWYKKHNRHAFSSENLATANIEEKADEKLLAWQVLEEVHRLPDKEKEVVFLVIGEGLSHGEVAKLLNCKESTVSWRLHEARKKLNGIFVQEHLHG